MPEQIARFTVLLEDIQIQVRAIADGHVGLNERMDRIDARFDRLETKVDALDIKVGGLEIKVGGLETKVGGLETKVGTLETKFEGFADDTRRRLERIETHLALNGPLPQRRATRAASARHRKRTAKPT
jgi:archaellum component FlaC